MHLKLIMVLLGINAINIFTSVTYKNSRLVWLFKKKVFLLYKNGTAYYKFSQITDVNMFIVSSPGNIMPTPNKHWSCTFLFIQLKFLITTLLRVKRGFNFLGFNNKVKIQTDFKSILF